MFKLWMENISQYRSVLVELIDYLAGEKRGEIGVLADYLSDLNDPLGEYLQLFTQNQKVPAGLEAKIQFDKIRKFHDGYYLYCNYKTDYYSSSRKPIWFNYFVTEKQYSAWFRFKEGEISLFEPVDKAIPLNKENVVSGIPMVMRRKEFVKMFLLRGDEARNLSLEVLPKYFSVEVPSTELLYSLACFIAKEISDNNVF